MGNEWSIVRIEDIAEKIAMGPFGSNIKVETFVDTGVPVISGSHLRGVRLEDGDFNFVTNEHAEKMKNSNVQRGDVIFTHAGNIGQVAYIPPNSQYDRYVISQRQFYLRCDLNKADPAFISYFFHSNEGQHKLLANASQTGVPSIARPSSYLKTIELSLPPMAQQRAIAHILGRLDDKIELNRKQNETLEAIASALFKAWFVDFEPVRAKMEGRWQRGQSLPGLPAHLYDLFPDRLAESELGEIPEGWEIGRVSDFLSLAYGKSLPAGSRNPGVVPVYGSGGVTGYHDTSLLDVETVIVGRKGTVGSLYWEPLPCFPIDTVFYVQPLVPLPFCYHLLESLPLSDMNTDAAVPGLNRENVYRLEVVAPPQPLIKEFSDLARKFRDQIFRLHAETRILAQLRDTLLPKLLSGELRVLDPERIIGALI
ncbi:restriction endonuclease subunit S [Methylophilus sp. TWE2]|uniref:restriction endonuclease subunit S n=1 Tax=Methylophilus sp. TWE2 TaxID=1662285 RepID=UPI0006717C9C|nr:restriction endonuclease subunit S [Methylophilus sp. TWE2]AKR42023.1 restriction modification system, type I [Methylophilus sp. TWE2]